MEKHIKRKFTIQEKIKIVEYAKNNTIHGASRKFECKRRSVRYWISQIDDLKMVKNKKTRNTLHHGKKPSTLYLEPQLLDFIKYNRGLGNPIDSWAILVKLFKLDSRYSQRILR